MHPEVRLLSQKLENHEEFCERDRAETRQAFAVFEANVAYRFRAMEAKFDRFDNKLWAIVVMVALGVLVALIKDFMQ